MSEWQQNPVDGGQAPWISHGADSSHMYIGNQPATEAFASLSNGENAAPYDPKQSQDLDNSLDQDQSDPTRSNNSPGMMA